MALAREVAGSSSSSISNDAGVMFWNCGSTTRAKLEKVVSVVNEGETRAYAQWWAMGGIVSGCVVAADFRTRVFLSPAGGIDHYT